MATRIQEFAEGPALAWLLRSAAEPMILAGESGLVLLANPPAQRLFGYPDADMVGKPMEDLLPERFRRDVRALDRDGQLRGLRQDGSEFLADVSISRLQTGQGAMLILATIRHTMQPAAAESALQEGEARIRAIVDTAVDAIITIDERGVIDRFNPAAERLFGYSAAEVAGKNVSMLMPAPYHAEHDGYLTRYRQTGEKRIIGIGREVTGLRKNGATFPMQLSVAEMRIGERRMFTGILRDITESEKAEEALRQSHTELRQLAAHLESVKEAERKRIAQEIHDELGALMTGIKANISVLIERAERAGLSPDPLLIDAASLADTGFQAVRRVVADLRPSVLDHLGLWAALEWYASQVDGRSGISCRCDIDEEASAAELGPEPGTMVFRVVQEALTNAIRHAAASEAVVRATVEDGTLVVQVSDNGKGMEPTRRAQGSWGIVGMRERAGFFGGTLTVSSEPGKGTRVILRLPLENGLW